MKARYTLVIKCDGGDEIAQVFADTPAGALEQWSRSCSPGGIVDSLSTEDQAELGEDFSASDPTIFGITTGVDGLDGVWRISTALASGKCIEVVCVQCSAGP
jgi:hypothetical protein